MNARLRNLLIVSFPALLAVQAFGQGTFQNLDFEHPIPPLIPDPYFAVAVTNALPGWTPYIGGGSLDRVTYNTVSLGAADISLQGPGSIWPVLQGSYTVLLQSDYPNHQFLPSIAQVGTIPGTAQSLLFYSYEAVLSVTFAGQPISLSLLGSTPKYALYAGDISMFAGQAGELRFTGGGYLDNIQFSPSPIPEPSTVGLFALGGLLCGWRLLRKRQGERSREAVTA